MVPNLILNSFRRTIMPKGSFFPLPTKTPVASAKPRRRGRTGKRSRAAAAVFKLAATPKNMLRERKSWLR